MKNTIQPVSFKLIKAIISFVVLLGMLTTIYFWQGSFGYSQANNYMSLSLSLVYGLTILAFGILNPIRKVKKYRPASGN